MTFRCPNCNARNQTTARFCLECGEPLNAEHLVLPPQGAEVRLGSVPAWVHSRETWLGAGILALLIALAIFSAWQGAHDRQEAAYRQALADLAAHNWQAALTELWVAGDYADAPRRLYETRDFWTHLQKLATDVDRAEKAGSWGTAEALWRQILALDPLYPDAPTRLAAARQHVGVIVYRLPGDRRAGIWWANGDGSDPRPFPAGPDITVYGVSPDGRWAVYSSPGAPAPADGYILYVLDLETGQRQAVPLPPDVGAPGTNPVRFCNDSAGFWWVAAGGWSYYDLATGQLTPIADQVLAADPENARLLLLMPGRSTPILGISNRVMLADAFGRSPRMLWIERGSMGVSRISPDGKLLLYQVREGGSLPSVQVRAVVLPPPGDTRPPPGQRAATLDTRPLTANGPFQPFASAFLALGPDGAWRGLVSWLNPQLRQVSVALNRADEFAVGELQLGPNVQLLGLRSRVDGSYFSVQVGTPTGVQLDWLGYTPDRQRIVYLAPGSAGQQGLYTTTIDRASRDISGLPRYPTLIFTRAADPAAWTHSTGFAHDGAHILVILAADQVTRPPGSPSSPAGLWSLGVDGTNPKLLIPYATEFWTPEGWLGSP